jgi:LacI family gluconate utilization system Gnt-I transcriptional repressor
MYPTRPRAARMWWGCPLPSNNLFVDLLDAVQRTLLPHGYQPLIGVTHYSPDEEEQLLQSYMVHRPAGLLVTGFDRSEKSRTLILAAAVLCVHLMETTSAEACLPRRLLTSGFWIRNHPTFGEPRPPPHCICRGPTRPAGDATRARLPALPAGSRPLRRALGVSQPTALLDCAGRSDAAGVAPTATRCRPRVFCNDALAQGGLLAALRLGLKVPQDLAVAGFTTSTAAIK